VADTPRQVIPTHTAIAIELLFNAIDSGADSITLTVDLWRNQIRCRDNGIGILPHRLPDIFNASKPLQKLEPGRFRRFRRTLASIAIVAEVTILTRTSGDEVPRRISNHSPIYIAPFFAPGTETVASASFDSVHGRLQQMATAAWKRDELKSIRVHMNMIALNLPEIAFSVDLGNTKIELPKCRTIEERWKQITGTQMRFDSDGRIVLLRSASSLQLHSTFSRFIANGFPVHSLRLDGVELTPNPNAVTRVNGEISDLEWSCDGLSCNVKTAVATLSEPPAQLTLSLDNEMITRMTVVGVFADGFILCNLENLLWAIDQHAAHERILLDEMLDDVDRFLGLRELKLPLKVAFEAGQPLTAQIQADLRRWGWTTTKIGSSWHIYSIPVVDGVAVDDIEAFVGCVNECSDGIQGRLPKCLLHKFQTRACKRAIKFGDAISEERAQGLVVQLLKCKWPNHCAHGRTVAAPIFDFDRHFTQFFRVQVKYRR
jgi:DNA mismatch repair ATPase MutL